MNISTNRNFALGGLVSFSCILLLYAHIKPDHNGMFVKQQEQMFIDECRKQITGLLHELEVYLTCRRATILRYCGDVCTTKPENETGIRRRNKSIK